MMKVGKDIIVDKKTNKIRKLSYRDVEYGIDAWVDANKYLPADFELLYLKIDNSIYCGWLNGTKWDGKMVNEKHKINYWKRHK